MTVIDAVPGRKTQAFEKPVKTSTPSTIVKNLPDMSLREPLLVLLFVGLTACGDGSPRAVETTSPGDTNQGSEEISNPTSEDDNTNQNDPNQNDLGQNSEGSQDDGNSGQGSGSENPSIPLSQAIQGAWQSECVNYTNLGISDREINVITDKEIIRDWYEYTGPDCTGAPRGLTFPIRIAEYSIGSELVTNDGVDAIEIDMTFTQIPTQKSYLADAAVLAEQRHDIVAMIDGKLWRTSRESRFSDNRPSDFSTKIEFEPRRSLTDTTSRAEDFLGTWSTGCRSINSGFNSSVTLEAYANLQGYTETEDFYDGPVCQGEVVARLTRTWETYWGPSFKTVFGDTVHSVRTVQYPKEIVFNDGTLSSSLNLDTLKTRYHLYALVDGNTLMRGFCLKYSTACQKSVGRQSDMIDLEFNSTVRYSRINP